MQHPMTKRNDSELRQKPLRHWMSGLNYFFAAQQPFLAAQQPFLAAQQPFFAEQPFLAAQQPFLAAQQPFLPAHAETFAEHPFLALQDAIAGTAAIAAAATIEALTTFFNVLLSDIDFMYYSSVIKRARSRA